MPLPTDRSASFVARGVSAALIAILLSVGPLAVRSAQAGSVIVRDFVLTRGIGEREPMGTTEGFAPDDRRGFAFARLANDDAPTSVTFVWEVDEAVHASIEMNVGTSSNWRTWTSVTLHSGNWRVKLMDENGLMLAEKAFTVQ